MASKKREDILLMNLLFFVASVGSLYIPKSDHELCVIHDFHLNWERRVMELIWGRETGLDLGTPQGAFGVYWLLHQSLYVP